MKTPDAKPDPSKDLKELEEVLRNSDEVQLQIIHDLGTFTVALFGVFGSKEGDRLVLAGTGTLVTHKGSIYILTASHVWEEILKSAVKMGITLDEKIDHQFLIDVKAIEPFGPPKPDKWDEWGPDIVFLRIPNEHRGTIIAYRDFYDPEKDGKISVDADHLECRILMGAPKALGTFTQIHAHIEINGFFLQADAPFHKRDGYDYIDFQVNTAETGIPNSFGGVSGGGSWRVLVHQSASKKINWTRVLEGVAFWESDMGNSHLMIRCHGPETIRTAMPAD